ncbi:Exostosin family protein [Halothece sp. PCC 7418]|uniref:exostosin domain-containing protein n=1 Tax=Halothece sp. (strain PCC 7418) TaxID=65093 RepID=UPI0002A06080|nr:exostosin family protein [Halothece sp. PCC 7418]AFZ44917.1 Exostosin family protein [Halothece sp. PCC 7418]
MVTKLGIWSPQVECLAYTIARSCAGKDCQVTVFTKPKQAVEYRGHAFYYEKLQSLEQVKIIHTVHEEENILDWLYLLGFDSTASKQDLMECAQKAKHIGLYSGVRKSSYPRNIWHQIKEFIKLFPLSSQLNKVFLADGFYSFDFYSAIAQRELVGIDVHSNFLENQELYEKLFAFQWQPQNKRKYQFNFIGNRSPNWRTQIINQIRGKLEKQQFSLTTDPEFADNSSNMLWIEYGDEPGEKRGVSPQEYIQCLLDSDFTLCPPGYSRLTHRVVEALVLGSIPVLHEEELEIYDLSLKDGYNCLAVKNQNWLASIEKIMTMNQVQIESMRKNILTMKESYLTDKAFCKRLKTKMGAS